MSVPKQLNPAESTRDLLRVGPVRNLLGSSVFISSGVMLQATVLGKQIYDITGRELDIGLLGLAEFLPAALLVLVTGSVADRFNRKIVGGIAVAFELLCSIALAFYALSNPTAVWPLFVIAFVFGCARAFAAPAFVQSLRWWLQKVLCLERLLCTQRHGRRLQLLVRQLRASCMQ